MIILNIDLDFFLNDIALDRPDDGPRLGSQYFPWSEEKVIHFLEKKHLGRTGTFHCYY